MGVGGARAKGRVQETGFWVHVSPVYFATEIGVPARFPCGCTRRWRVSSKMGSASVGAVVSRRCVGAASLMLRRKGLFEAVLVRVEGVVTFVVEIGKDVRRRVSRVTKLVEVVGVLRDVRRVLRDWPWRAVESRGEPWLCVSRRKRGQRADESVGT